MTDMTTLQILAGTALTPFAGLESTVPPLAEETFALDAPDLHLACVEAGTVRARCSLWWQHTPTLPGAETEKIGLIGHYAAFDDAAADVLLTAATTRLADAGCTCALGPMDGATWRPYRFVTEPGDHPPFFLEPTHPAAYPAQFARHGFAPYLHYYSALVPDLSALPAPAPTPPLGVTVRTLDPNRLAAELGRLYALTRRCFADNPLYTPPPEAAFLAQYRTLLPVIDPELVLIAEHDAQPVGYLFMLPDLCQKQRGESIDTVLLKTMAVVPELRGYGLGRWLLAHGQQRACERGYRRAIHALMHQRNPSRRISSRYAEPLRQYALLARPL